MAKKVRYHAFMASAYEPKKRILLGVFDTYEGALAECKKEFDLAVVKLLNTWVEALRDN
jgi:hypothetical protein